MRVALVERKLFGGTCVNTGCIPTKTLVASARAAHVARRGAEFGFAAGEVRVDMKAVKARKDGVVQQSRNGLAGWIGGMKNVSLIEGHARFTAPSTVAVNGRLLAAERVFLNVGGSYIGLEFAQAYRRFGSRVTVVERMAKLLPREDDDVAGEIRAVLEREGVEIRTGAECMALSQKDDRIVVGL